MYVQPLVDTVSEESNDYFATRYWALKKSYDYFATRYWALKKGTIILLLVTGPENQKRYFATRYFPKNNFTIEHNKL